MDSLATLKPGTAMGSLAILQPGLARKSYKAPNLAYKGLKTPGKTIAQATDEVRRILRRDRS